MKKYIYEDGVVDMGKFERDPVTREYVCPVCERRYTQYNSLFKHYQIKHGDEVNVNSDGDTEKTSHQLTEAVKEPLKRVKLKPVIPAVKPVKKTEKDLDEKQEEGKEDEAEAVVVEGRWLLPGLILVSGKKKSEKKDDKKKWVFIKGII